MYCQLNSKMMFKRVLVVLTIVHLGIMLNVNAKNPTKYFLYVGAYADKADEGIYVYEFDVENGGLKYVATAEGIKNPSYLAISKKKNLLFAVNETEEYNGEKSGFVTSFWINPANGQLIKINEVASGGGAPCYISINKTASMAFVANYLGGNVCVIPIEQGGRLKKISSLIQHESNGPDEKRQQKAHAHFIDLDPSRKYALAVDLGIDKIISYKIDQKHEKLVHNSELNTALGAGPRHLAFHPNRKLAFYINELNSTITSCRYDIKTGSLAKIMTTSTLPAGFDGESFCADIHVSPDGRFLYGSNRGHNSIVVYEIDQNSGNISLISHHSVKGDWPRNFVIDPLGRFLLVANQHSNNIVVFKIDKESGMLRSNGVEIAVNKPVCLKMMPFAE